MMNGMTGRGLANRVCRLEEEADAQAACAEAERIGEMVGAPPDVLLARAVEIGALIERHGYERSIELVAAGVGLSAEDLEGRVGRLAEP